MPQFPLIPLEGLNSGFSEVILTQRAPVYPYKDKKRISDIPERWRYIIALPGYSYTPLTVSVDGSVDALANIRDEDIADACASLQPILVSFTNCYVRIFTINNEQRMTATASGIELVKSGK